MVSSLSFGSAATRQQYSIAEAFQREITKLYEAREQEQEARRLQSSLSPHRGQTFFREENGRTRREFFRELAAEAGYRLNWSRVKPELMIEASIQSHEHRDNSGLIAVIRSSIEPPKVFRAPTEPGRGTARDRKALAEKRLCSSVQPREISAICQSSRENLQSGGIAAGWALAKSQQHVAIATSPNQFLVLHRSLLSKDVELGQKIQLEMKKDRAVVRSLERSRGR